MLTVVAVIGLIFAFGVSQARAGTIIADYGFKADVNGFSFPNYTNENSTNLDPAQVQRIFGSRVCLTGKRSSCVLTSAAAAWMEDENEGMDGGHCYGMSSLASIIKANKLNRFGYKDIFTAFGGGPNAYDLSFENNIPLQGAIARAFVAQTFPSVQIEDLDNVTPNRILAYLKRNLESFDKNPQSIGIYKPGFRDGHAITPIALEDMGEGIYNVLVYDNNLPGKTRRLTINSRKNTWRYYATINPGFPQALYRGNAKTKTLDLSPVNPQLGVQTCTFCTGRQGGAAKYNQVTLSATGKDHARLRIIDSRGRQTGIINGRQVTQIPGSKIFERSSQGVTTNLKTGAVNAADSLEPVYLIPKRFAFKVRISGWGLSYQDTESLSIVGSTFDATINDLSIGKKQTAYASINPKRQRIAFTSVRAVRSSPFVSVGAQSRTAAYQINVGASNEAKGQTVILTKNSKKGLVNIAAVNPVGKEFVTQITKTSKSGTDQYVAQYRLQRSQRAYLRYAPLARKNGVAQVVIINRTTKKLVKRIPIRKV